MEVDAADTTITAAAATTTTTTTTSAARVQHITKASSDELLSKFAQVGATSNKLALTLVTNKKNKKLQLSSKRQRSIDRSNPDCESPTGVSVADRKLLLPPANKRGAATFIRRLGIGKAKLRSRNINNKSLLGGIEKVS